MGSRRGAAHIGAASTGSTGSTGRAARDSRLPRVAAITAVQCDAALLEPEHHHELLKLQLVGTMGLAALAGARARTQLGAFS